MPQNNRRQAIQQQFKKYNIPFTFFDAVDGRQGLPPEYENMVDRELAYKRFNRHLTDTEIACALSHYLVYKHIINNNIPHAIIMEDDAILTDNFKTFIDNAVYTTCGADMIFLYHFFASVHTTYVSHYNIKYYPLKKMPYGAVAYYITAPVAHILCENIIPISYSADFPMDLTRKYKIVATYPRIIQHPVISDTQSALESARLLKNSNNCLKSKITSYITNRKLLPHSYPFMRSTSLNISPDITGNRVVPPKSLYAFIRGVLWNICKKSVK